jgi:hypothetical protein
LLLWVFCGTGYVSVGHFILVAFDFVHHLFLHI